MPESDSEPTTPVTDAAEAAPPPADSEKNFFRFFKKEESEGPAEGVETRHVASQTAAGPEPLVFQPSAEALKDPEKMAAEFRKLVEEDLEDGGSVLITQEHAASMANYYRQMEAEAARARTGQETVGQAEAHMTELTREELIRFWKTYAGIGLLCLAL